MSTILNINDTSSEDEYIYDDQFVIEDEFSEEAPIDPKRIEFIKAESIIEDEISNGGDAYEFGQLQVVDGLITKHGKIFLIYGGGRWNSFCDIRTLGEMAFTDNVIPTDFTEYSRGLYACRV
jgi:hypothetical protein